MLDYLYLKHWKLASQEHRIRMLLATTLTFLSVYIAAPSIKYYFLSEEEKQKMFSSKRQDKHTTGLINTRNDCFANSSVQAFAALPGLNTYLNEMIKQHQLMDSLPLPKDDPAPGIPLHLALADIVATLQEPITSSKEVSVWPFLQVIEKIFSSKISTNQNDAHELVQLILETLDNETTKLKKYAKKHKLNLLIPELPFNGLLADQLTCYSCLNSSKPSFHPFSVMSLPVPQERSATLSDMLKTNEVETINGYHCLRCKLKAILKIENEKIEKGIPLNEDEAQIVSKLKVMEPNLTINDDLPEPLEQWVKEYTSQGFKTSDLLSTIVKKTLVVKPPNLLTVHLSRSMFTANHLTRNSCRVEFEETLTLDVDENLAREYEIRQKASKRNKKQSTTVTPAGEIIDNAENEDIDDDIDDDDDIDGIEGYDDDRHEPEQLKRIHSKVLTQHDEDAGHVEDAEHSENANSDSLGSEPRDSSTDATSIGSRENDVEDEEPEDDDNASTNSDALSDELNIIKDKVRYRLRAVIRHQGTHQAGHYECYRHKPLFVKDSSTGKVICLTPKIVGWETDQPPPSSSPVASPTLRHPEPVAEGKPSNFLSPGSTPADSVSRNSDAVESGEEGEGSFSRFRSRLGSIVSRRSSISHSPQPPRDSGGPLPTPNVADITASFEQFDMNAASQDKNKKYKKVSTVSKYPYWRISDTTVNEAKSSQLLAERTAVYMIYYERVGH